MGTHCNRVEERNMDKQEPVFATYVIAATIVTFDTGAVKLG
jgi:hypothetical protein